MIGIRPVIDQRGVFRKLIIDYGKLFAQSIVIFGFGCHRTKGKRSGVYLFFDLINLIKKSGGIVGKGTERIPFLTVGAVISSVSHEIIRIIAYLRDVGLHLLQTLVTQRQSGQRGGR